MLDFHGWCEKHQFDVTLPEPVKAESNSAKRAAVRSHAYPELYGRSQYPDGYFRPIAADAAYYQSVEKNK